MKDVTPKIKNLVLMQQASASKGINIFSLEGDSNPIRTFDRKDFYKICFYEGEAVVEYADKSIIINGSTLFFGASYIPYSWKEIKKTKSYACLFAKDFLNINDHSESLQHSPLFKIDGTPIFYLNAEQALFSENIFKKMIEEYNTEYLFKRDLIRNYINLLIHEALKIQPAENYLTHKSGSERIASLFLELLERQFPIESPVSPLKLKTAKDYAKVLSIHINHLNRSVKEITGKSTSTHISERIITEAKTLLQNTEWSISDISYSLGYEYHTYFNNFFKKITGTTPSSFRK